MKKSDWEDIGQTEKFDHYVYMMEQEKELKSIQHFTKLSYEMLEISTGDSVIEVGCGTGDDAVKFYNIVGPSGRLWELITANK